MNTKLDLRLLEELMNNIYKVFPKIVFGLLFIIVSWLILKIVLYVVKKSLNITKINHLTKKINEVPFLSTTLNIKPEKIIIIFIKWFLILVFVIVGSDLLGLDLISNELSKLIDYLPKIFSALVIFIFGIYGATYLKKSIQSLLKAIDINGSKAISQIIFIVLALMVSIMALNQLGLNTEIVTSNLFLILGAILAAFTIAFGLGSRDIIFRLLLGFYSKRNFNVGQRILIDGEEGIIVSIENISMVVSFANKKVVYPVKYITNKKIEILD